MIIVIANVYAMIIFSPTQSISNWQVKNDTQSTFLQIRPVNTFVAIFFNQNQKMMALPWLQTHNSRHIWETLI